MSSEDIYKPNDFYRIRDRGILKDGHSMLIEDVANDLNNYRRGYLKLEAENKRLRAALKDYAYRPNWGGDLNTIFLVGGSIRIAEKALKGE